MIILDEKLQIELTKLVKQKFDCIVEFETEMKRIKVVGLKSRKAKEFTDDLLVRLSKYNFPQHWEDIFKLLNEKSGVIVKNIKKTEEEWKEVE
jgi:hypothetical protein